MSLKRNSIVSIKPRILTPGQLWEAEVFNRASSNYQRPEYKPYIEAISEVFQAETQAKLAWDSSAPSTLVGKDLFNTVKSLLSEDDQSKLKLYSAIGTPLDYYHGIDGMFTLKARWVPLDLTVNPHKEAKFSRIVLFSPSDYRYNLLGIGLRVIENFKNMGALK